MPDARLRGLLGFDHSAAGGSRQKLRFASAATLTDVVEFYKTTLKFEFTDEEERDLVNFLSAL